VVIDPGGDLPDIERAIAQANVAVDKIWLTHGHVDHVAGAADLKARLKVPIEGPHKDDLFLLEHVVESARNFGMQDAANVTPDRWLEDGDQVEVGELTFDVLHCPGHSPGSVAYFNPAEHLAIVGDVLFAGSVGSHRRPWGQSETTVQIDQGQAPALGGRCCDHQRTRPDHDDRPRTIGQSLSSTDGRGFPLTQQAKADCADCVPPVLR
jgi:hydroxyacylglutathione hydrolase